MTQKSFEAAFRRELRDHWPQATDEETSMRVAAEYVGARYGEPGFDWSDEAAVDLARIYVADVGERP